MYRRINLKENMPSVDYAVFMLDQEIMDSKKIGNKVIFVLHGYGSCGTKSKIREELKFYYQHLVNCKKIAGFVFGEKWSSDEVICKKILENAVDIEIKENLLYHNAGISVILLI